MRVVAGSNLESVIGRSEVVIALSPHLDDAVFSIGGFLARCSAEGRRVIVASVYTKSPPWEVVPARYRRLLVHAERKLEDEKALSIIGAEPMWLEFAERATMFPALKGFLGVMSLPEAGTAGSYRQLCSLIERLQGLMGAFPNCVVLSPFGVGTHVDHVETFLAAASLCARSGRHGQFAFYEDIYSLSLRARRRHPWASARTWPAWKSPLWRHFKAGPMFGVIGLAGRGAALVDAVPSEFRQLDCCCCPVSIRETEDLKLKAVLAYESQTRRLGGAGAWEKTLPRYHKLWGGAEPLWVVGARESGSAAVQGWANTLPTPAGVLQDVHQEFSIE